MNRHLTSLSPLVVLCVAGSVIPTLAQDRQQSEAKVRKAAVQMSAPARAELLGVVEDDRGEPLAGVVVSALGATAVFAVSDSQGRFAFRDISYGPYLVRAHLQDHLAARPMLVQVNRSSDTMSTVVLTRRSTDDEPRVLSAGIGPTVPAPVVDDAEDDHDHGEVAWRLRHLKRSILKNVDTGVVVAKDDGDSFLGDAFGGFGRVVGSPARLAASLFSDVPVTGQVDLLTGTSFDQPQDLLSMQPMGVAFVSLEAPTGEGHWAMRAALMQGDLSSWVLAGSYRHAPGAHSYEAGLSYATQRYQGGNLEALPLVADPGRSVGVIRVYDDWTINPRVSVRYGAKYGRYDYLDQAGLLSPSASMTLTPFEGDSFKIRATASRLATAPGAAEFVPQSTGPWVVPERTFSPIASGQGFTAERVRHVEFAAEREWGQAVAAVRLFRQTVDNQVVTLFGSGPDSSAGRPGHYFVASAGDIEATGWSVSARRATESGNRASIEYTNVGARWTRRSPDAQVLALIAGTVPSDIERVHDLTASVEGVLPLTETRVFMVYKINSRFAESGPGRQGARFDIRVNQSLPFLNFSGARWEVLMAMRSMFSDGAADASIYDELLVVRSPKRMVGGVAVRF